MTEMLSSKPTASNVVQILGVGFWSSISVSWTQACGDLALPVAPNATQARPVPSILSANERRRAPDSVLLALAVAEQAMNACACALDAKNVPSVFASAHGDLAIVDALCRTLADSPLLLSPTRFHHSVHNVASGYWAMCSGSHASSTAISAHEYSFAQGWLEAVALLRSEQSPVLLVAYDTHAAGPLASVNRSRGLLGLGLVLSPVSELAEHGAAPAPKVSWSLFPAATAPTEMATPWGRAHESNAMAAVIPFLECLALRFGGSPETARKSDPTQTRACVDLKSNASLSLRLSIS
jgi:hypothetical protein